MARTWLACGDRDVSSNAQARDAAFCGRLQRQACVGSAPESAGPFEDDELGSSGSVGGVSKENMMPTYELPNGPDDLRKARG